MVQPIVIFEGTLLPNAAAVVGAPNPNNPSPAGVTTIIKKFTVTNTDGAAGHTFTIYLGNGANPVNLLVNARAIGLNETLDITEAINHELAPGDSIQAFADVAAKVSIRASGVQIA